MTPAQSDLTFLYDPQRYERGAPLQELAALREQQAVLWVEEHALPQWAPGPGFWLVLRHGECLEVLKNPALYSSHLGATQLRNPATAADLAYVQQMMLNMDPPQHTRLRRLLINAFTRKAIGRLEQQITSHARGIVDRVIDGQTAGQCDFVSDIAADMPLLCLADLFGLPREDRHLMLDWANRVIGYQDPDYAGSATFDDTSGTEMAREALRLRPRAGPDGTMPDPRSREGMADLYHYAHLLAEHKRAQPADDVMSLLLAEVDDQGQPLSIAEFENMFWLFAVAGNETLRNGIPGGMVALLENPQSWQAIRRDPRAVPQAVEEMLRWWTPVMNFRRTATRNTTLSGAHILAGDKVVVSFLSANHDQRVFRSPQQFDITRDPNSHLAFGYGPHYCIGAQLAVAQMRALFVELSRRLEVIESTGTPRYLRSNFQRGIKSLPIRWQAATRQARGVTLD